MLLAVWLSAIIAEVSLLSIRPRRPAFTIWLAVTISANLIELAICRSPAYDPFWRGSELIRLALLIAVVRESARSSIPQRYPLGAAAAASIAIHFLLRYPYRWPSSYLEAVYSALAFGNLILGLFLVQLAPRGKDVILTIYLLATAACYYSASAFPVAIGVPIMLVEFSAMVGWMVVGEE